MPRITKIQDPKIDTQIVTGFLGGLNTFQDDTQIKDSELTEAKNIILSIDGIQVRPGTINYGSTSGTGLLGGFPYYKSDGTREFLRFTKGANNKLQKYAGTTPTDILGTGGELLSSSGWTSAGWSGAWSNGWIHTIGNTTALAHTLAATVGYVYRVYYTIADRNAGTIAITFGGASTASVSATGYTDLTATTTGTVSIAPTTDFDGSVIFSIKRLTEFELLSATGWTATNWTGSWAAGYDHTTGNTSALSNTITATKGYKYRITYTVSGRTAGTFTITFGGVTGSALSATGTNDITAISTGALSIAPTSDFDGAIILSIKEIMTFAPTTRMNFVQARDKAFIFNGVDNLAFYDGVSVTAYTTLATPAGLTVAPQGAAGSTAYSYRVSAFNSVGETLACTSVAIANGNATLDGTNYNKIDWTAVTGATGYNIFGRKSTGLGETYMATVYTNTYNDKNTDTPSLSILPPEGNTTQGIKCSMAVFAISRIFAAGDTTYPSRLYFGGTGEQIGNFSGSSIGGGGVDVFKNDGAIIRDILPFQGGVIIWKDNAIYKFSFSSDGSQMLEEITRSFGGIAFRSSKHVENDVIFAAKKDGRLAFYSLGNQAQYAATVLRTNELSIKVAEKLSNVNLGGLQNSAAFYFNNIYGCAIPTEGSTVNDRIWCLDTRFGAWVYWEGIHANFFTEYTDSAGNQKLYAGSDDTGYMIEMFTDTRLDNSSAIDVHWATKSFNQKIFHKKKEFYSPVFQFKDVTKSGALEGSIYLDGAISSATFSINQQTQGGAGMGVYLPGFHLLGEAPGIAAVSGLSADIPVEVSMVAQARAIKYDFHSNVAVDARYKFLSLAHSYMVLESELSDTNRVYPS